MTDKIIFLDTNILVYANDNAYPEKQKIARNYIREVIITGNGYISTQVLAEFWVTVTQKLPTCLSQDLAREQISLFSNFHIIPVEYPTILEAIRLQERYQISFWDAQIIASALQVNATVLLTEDLQHGLSINSITIQNPFL
ncbi:PIN domain-containing protein [Gracilinema caldarium]|uniref:PilT protein domain protein n=1 Tax=Gracilinema caldarium (strain ATCC 51460 / DSM 7334 / H1) TaxID=744872 RepID=F8F2B8_GRAC1|nr:PIN domain-containing protein [Gracilinema caldarium]AEJ20900.1 PilT protein domain protein [Gracilinema caldarium DSM 7334]